MMLVGEPPVTATQKTEVTQDTAPVSEPASGVVAVLAMVLQFEAATVAGEEAAPAIELPPPIASGTEAMAMAQPKAPKRSSERMGDSSRWRGSNPRSVTKEVLHCEGEPAERQALFRCWATASEAPLMRSGRTMSPWPSFPMYRRR